MGGRGATGPSSSTAEKGRLGRRPACDTTNFIFSSTLFLCRLTQHFDFRDVEGSFVGVNMSLHLHVVAFMAFERLRIFDGPGLPVVVCDKRDFVTFYFDRTFSMPCRAPSTRVAEVF